MTDIREPVLLAYVEAKQRPRMTRHLLDKTDLTVPQAIALLRTCPVEPLTVEQSKSEYRGFGPAPEQPGKSNASNIWDNAHAVYRGRQARRDALAPRSIVTSTADTPKRKGSEATGKLWEDAHAAASGQTADVYKRRREERALRAGRAS